MKNMLSRDTVFARPLVRYATQYGPVSVFMHEQLKNLCIIRSDLTGQEIGATVAIRPAKSLVRREMHRPAVPGRNIKMSRLGTHPLRTQSEVDSDY